MGRTGAGEYSYSYMQKLVLLIFCRQKLFDASFVPVNLISSRFLRSILNLIKLSSVVELQSGKIEIDGVNTRDIGLDVLRNRLALVPQDSTLFLGTLRDNL